MPELSLNQKMLCERVQGIREGRGYSQEDWATLMGETHRDIRAMERAEIPVTTQVLQRIIELWDYSGTYLLTGEGYYLQQAQDTDAP